jgi:hypothetical protein
MDFMFADTLKKNGVFFFFIFYSIIPGSYRAVKM